MRGVRAKVGNSSRFPVKTENVKCRDISRQTEIQKDGAKIRRLLQKHRLSVSSVEAEKRGIFISNYRHHHRHTILPPSLPKSKVVFMEMG